MNLDELSKKEVINYNDGIKLGHLGEAELLIDCNTGEIKALLLPEKKGPLSFSSLAPGEKSTREIPWGCVVKVGVDMVIVDLKENKA